MDKLRSSCPINFGLEIFGDRWSLLIIRDIVFNGKNTYGEFVASAEGISTNILAKRLARLEQEGLIEPFKHPENRKTIFYGLTDKGAELIPVLVELILWGVENGPANEALSEWAGEIRKNKSRAIRAAVAAAESNLQHRIEA